MSQIVLQVDNQELNTILAALRYYQREGMGEPANRPAWLHAIACGETPAQEEDISLDAAGIDQLCVKLNFAPET